jgi:adenosylcobyric acid synthase
LFSHDGQRAAWLKWIGACVSTLAYSQEIERVLDSLAAHLEAHVDLDALFALAR